MVLVQEPKNGALASGEQAWLGVARGSGPFIEV